ncbi:hypothetical protein Q7P37_005873 [Cladosporium fusiforme]
MCIVEQKTYYQADGSPRISESIRRCENAIGLDVCLNVNYSVAKIVETRPEPSSSSRVASSSRTESSSKGHVIVTDSRGQTRVYHDLNRRSSQRNRSGRSRREEDRNRDAVSSSAFNTERSSPVSRTATPNSAPPRMSSFPPTLGPAPSSRVTADGTAIYDYPTSDTRRVPIVERRPASPPRRKVSFKETPHDNDATDRRRPGLSVNTGGRRSTNTSPTRSSPGLSQLPNLRHARKDSARDLPPRSTSREDKEYTTRESAREEARRILAHAEASRRRQEDLRAAEDRELDLEAERAERGTRLVETLRPTRASIDSERSSRSRHTTPPRRQTYYPEDPTPRYASSSPITSRPSPPPPQLRPPNPAPRPPAQRQRHNNKTNRLHPLVRHRSRLRTPPRPRLSHNGRRALALLRAREILRAGLRRLHGEREDDRAQSRRVLCLRRAGEVGEAEERPGVGGSEEGVLVMKSWGVICFLYFYVF